MHVWREGELPTPEPGAQLAGGAGSPRAPRRRAAGGVAADAADPGGRDRGDAGRRRPRRAGGDSTRDGTGAFGLLRRARHRGRRRADDAAARVSPAAPARTRARRRSAGPRASRRRR
ncbi:MAG: hypothetical protein MZW92_59985 [Comamonadaceae bacterium]|nr:hypothetical protein [Comamonadaceae bacterium]